MVNSKRNLIIVGLILLACLLLIATNAAASVSSNWLKSNMPSIHTQSNFSEQFHPSHLSNHNSLSHINATRNLTIQSGHATESILNNEKLAIQSQKPIIHASNIPNTQIHTETAARFNSCITINDAMTYTISASFSAPSNMTDIQACIFINASDVTLDGNGTTVSGYSNGVGIYAVPGLTNIVIKNISVNNFMLGIGLDSDVNNSLISHTNTNNNTEVGVIIFENLNDTLEFNTANNNGWGIMVEGGSDDNLTSNTADNNTLSGIWLTDRNIYFWADTFTLSNNILVNNIADNNPIGIAIIGGSYSTLTNNTANNNLYGDGIGIGIVGGSLNNTLDSNTANDNNNTGINIEDSTGNNLISNTANDNSADGIYLLNSDLNTLTSNTANDNGASTEFWYASGIVIENSSYNNLTYNTAYNNYGYGIFVYLNYLTGAYSGNNLFVNNTLTYNQDNGIYLDGSSNNELTSNTVNNNALGIIISDYYYGDNANNTLDSNIIDNNGYVDEWGGYGDGIDIFEADNLTIINNIIINNSYDGMYISDMDFSILDGNNMTGNGYNFAIEGTPSLGFNNTIGTDNVVDGDYIIYYNYSIEDYTFDDTSAPNAGTVICAYCNNVTVANLNLSHSNEYGALFYSTENSIIQNVTADNNNYGVQFYWTENSTIQNVTANDNGDIGILLQDGEYNILEGNNMSNNFLNFAIFSDSYAEEYYNNIIETNNVVDGNHNIYYNYSIENYSFNYTSAPNAGMVGCALCSNIVVKDLNLSHDNDEGLLLFEVDYSTIHNITANNNAVGIELYPIADVNITDISTNNNYGEGLEMGESWDVNITRITANNNGQDGISINFCDYNQLTGVTANNNGEGIWMSSSDDNNLTGITANNNWDGMRIDGSDDNNLTGITANNNRNGIEFYGSSSNNLTDFSIDNSSRIAIYLSGNNNLLENIGITNGKGYDLEVASGSDGNHFIDATIGPYIFYNNSGGSELYFENSNYGELRFLKPISGNGTSLSREIAIGSDSFYVNSTNAGLNQSANITFFNLPTYSDPVILRDGAICSDAVCANLTSLNAGNVTINVTGFSTYAISERPCTVNCTPAVANNEITSGGGSVMVTNDTNSIYYWYASYAISDEQFQTGFERVLASHFRINVKIGGDTHYVGVIGVNSTAATIQVNSNPQIAVLNAGETKKFDVNGDYVYDIAVTLNSIAGTMADLTVKATNQAMTAEEIAAAKAAEAASSGNVTSTTGNGAAAKSSWIWWVIGIIVILIAAAVIWWLVIQRRKSSYVYG